MHEERGVERYIHAAHDGGDHGLDLLGIGRAAGARRGKAMMRPTTVPSRPMRTTWVAITRRHASAAENAADAQRGHGGNQPAERRVAALEGLPARSATHQADQSRSSIVCSTTKREMKAISLTRYQQPHARTRHCRDGIASTKLREICNGSIPVAVDRRAVPLVVRKKLRVCNRHGTPSFQHAVHGVGRAGLGFDSSTNPCASQRFRRLHLRILDDVIHLLVLPVVAFGDDAAEALRARDENRPDQVRAAFHDLQKLAVIRKGDG
jgi:hypothetical protein